MNWYLDVLQKKYATFTGRARRTEYWMFVLFNFIISAGLGIVDTVVDPKARLLGGLYGLAVLVPGIAVGIRRLHDTNRSGWWLLIALVPLIGFVVLIVFLATEGNRGPNQYGSDPKLEPAPAGPGAAGQPAAQAGWFADPTGRHQFRYWDSMRWTEQVSDNGVQSTDHL